MAVAAGWIEHAASLELALCLVGLLVRACVSLHGYSGEASPPMYGDYEAQRHWMEVTVNLPPTAWYVDGPDNDLQYWGLDYPPLSALFSFALGQVAAVLHPRLVELHTSRGHESAVTRAFMRCSVLLSDAFVFFPAALAYARISSREVSSSARYRALAMQLLCPALILVDHGHFQYNCISLGLALWAFLAAVSSRPLACCVAFSLSLNFKQMSLYLAPAVFCYLFSGVVRRPSAASAVRSFIALGLATVLTFCMCWVPFLSSWSSVGAVLTRIFPTSRSLYEDKVANVWCTIALLRPLKLKEKLSVPILVKLTIASTLAAIAPPCAMLLRWPSRRAFLLCATACALAFFLLSFQVHEKHILLPLLPAALLSPHHSFFFGWFALVAGFSMFPLLSRDGLRLAYFVSQIGYAALTSTVTPLKGGLFNKIVRALYALSMSGMVVLHLAEATLTPPSRYPDIHPVAFSAFACVHFVGAYLLVLAYMWKISPKERGHNPLEAEGANKIHDARMELGGTKSE